MVWSEPAHCHVFWLFVMLCLCNLLKLFQYFAGDGRNDYSEDAILDNDEFFEGTENILPKNNWHMTGYDPKLLSHGNYFKVEPGSTVKMSCTFTNLSGLHIIKGKRTTKTKKNNQYSPR